MGAAACLYSALQDVGTGVDALILASPPSCYETRRKFVPAYLEALTLARSEGLVAAKRSQDTKARPPIFLETDAGRKTYEIGWREKFGMGLDRYSAAMEGAIASDLPSRERLGEIRCPVLVLAWRSDVQHPVATARMLADALPHVKLHVAGSWEEVERFPERMREFLTELVGP